MKLGRRKIDFRGSRDSLRVSILESLCCEGGRGSGFRVGESVVGAGMGSFGTGVVSVMLLVNSRDFVLFRFGVDFACRKRGIDGNLFNDGFAFIVSCGCCG